MSMTTTRTVACAWVLGCIAVLGCGSSGPHYDTARLEGRVEIDGMPIMEGSLQFIPLHKAQPAWAQVREGRYRAEKVPVGKVRVLFTAVRATGRMETDGGHVFPELVTLIPPTFQSGMELDVAGDHPSQDFLLVSRGRQNGSASAVDATMR